MKVGEGRSFTLGFYFTDQSLQQLLFTLVAEFREMSWTPRICGCVAQWKNASLSVSLNCRSLNDSVVRQRILTARFTSSQAVQPAAEAPAQASASASAPAQSPQSAFSGQPAGRGKSLLEQLSKAVANTTRNLDVASNLNTEAGRRAAAEGKTLTAACGDIPEDEVEDEEVEMEDMFCDTSMGREWGGPMRGGRNLEPTRFGDWERKGRCTDF